MKVKKEFYKDITNIDIKELAEDLNLNPLLAKEIEIWFANTDIIDSIGNERKTNLFKLFRKIAIDYYVGLTHTPKGNNKNG
jgi:hypothetical protein